ncbi:MAG: hypothetical protein KH359_10435 [Clostridiales bacterium]|nr:hypothetical protein [Clostridiales bacterium]
MIKQAEIKAVRKTVERKGAQPIGVILIVISKRVVALFFALGKKRDYHQLELAFGTYRESQFQKVS